MVGLASVHGGDGGTVSATATTMPTLPTLPTLLVVVAAGTGSERLAGLELLAPYRPSRFSQQEQSSQEDNGFFKTAVGKMLSHDLGRKLWPNRTKSL